MTRWTVCRQVRREGAWVDDATWQRVACRARYLALALVVAYERVNDCNWLRHVARGMDEAGKPVDYFWDNP